MVFSTLVFLTGMITVTICQHVIIMLHTILVLKPDHATLFFALLPYLPEKSETDRAFLLYQRDRKRENKEIVLTRIWFTEKGSSQRLSVTINSK